MELELEKDDKDPKKEKEAPKVVPPAPAPAPAPAAQPSGAKGLELQKEGEDPKDPKKDLKPIPLRMPNALYQPAVSMEFFKSAGKTERFEPGKPIFVENEGTANVFAEGSRMYLLLDGEVALSVNKKIIGAIGKGEIFGEMASITQLPRTATAVAKTACNVISLDEKQFQDAMVKSPEFALMLMNIIIARLRESVASLTSGGRLSEKDQASRAAVFDRKVLSELVQELEDKPAASHPAKKVIMKEGDKGMFSYVVLEGMVSISIGGKPVEKVGPGGMFGEMALVNQAPRVATATTDTDCSLLAVNRVDFMNLVKTKPAFALSLLKALSQRLRFMTAKYK